GRGGVDVVSRLLASGRSVDPEQIRRSREFGGDRFSEAGERTRASVSSGDVDDRGGEHVVSGGDEAAGGGWARVRLQVEHGVDARHVALLREGSDSSEVASARPDIWDAVSVCGELRDGVFA